MLNKLIKLANKLDDMQQYKVAQHIDTLIKFADQLQNTYHPVGQKGDEYGDNADQESEVSEEINDEMEAKDMEGYTPGNDNLIIDKNNNPTDGFGVLGRLSKRDILLKGSF